MALKAVRQTRERRWRGSGKQVVGSELVARPRRKICREIKRSHPEVSRQSVDDIVIIVVKRCVARFLQPFILLSNENRIMGKTPFRRMDQKVID
jgi:hypothetical protein